MNILQARHTLLSEQMLSKTGSKYVWQMVTIVVASLLIWASAKIQVPMWPVPMTFQTLVVLSLGFVLGPKLATMSVGLYLLEGAVGMPVFAGTPERGIGLAYMAGPTGGYLVGFLVAAAATGWLARCGWDRNVWTAGLAMAIGNLLIYAFGLLWLGTVIGWDKPVLDLGFYPFLIADGLEIVLAAVSFPLIWRRVRIGVSETSKS